MSSFKRRSSFGDATAADNDKRFIRGSARKRLASMFKSNLSIPAHASFGSPSLSYSPNLSLTTLPIYPSTTTSLSMPRTGEFQGLPTPFFPADAYYWTIADGNKSFKRLENSKSKPRSSLSSDSAGTLTVNTNDDINPSQTSLARAHSTSANSPTSSPRRAPQSSRRRPSTANPSSSTSTSTVHRTVAKDPPTALLPVIAAEDSTKHFDIPLPQSISPTAMPMKQFIEKNGKRHHPYPSSKAPYPRSYDSTAIDHDTSTHIFFGTLCKSVTFHEFSTPPTNILDLGCGNGVWVLEAAKCWPCSKFVGLDLMPLQPNLSVVAPRLQDRIQWLTANFLEPLPFEDNHFDFVHIRRIARGVPENKWPFLLEEVSRVLKPGGALEVVEEDLIFPGGQEPCTCHYPPDLAPPEDLDEPMSLLSAVSSSHEEQHGRHPLDGAPDTPVPSTNSNDTAHPYFYSSPLVSSRDHSKLEEAYNDMHSSKFINLMPISVLTETLEHYFTDVRSHPPVLVTFPPPEEEMWSDGSASGTERSMTSVSTDGAGKSPSKTYPRRAIWSRPSTADSSIGSSGGSPTFSSLAMSPISPSDARQTIECDGFPAGGDSIPAAANAATTGYMMHPPVGGWHTLHLDVRSLVHPRQPFMMIDRCRMPARGHGYGVPVVPAGDGSPPYAYSPMTRLPNTTFDFDLQSLTLLLSQSVTEVLECSEAIWEYLVETGKARTKKPRPVNPSYTLSYGPAASVSTVSTASQGLVDREEFDHWISKYEKEMHARIGMAEALRRRFGWETKGLSSDYVSRARPLPIQPTTPATTAPTSASATTPPRPRLLGDPSSDDMLTAGHSSSSTSLVADEENHNDAGNNNKMGITRQRTGSAPERISGEHHRKGAGKHVAARSQVSMGGGGSHSRSQSLDAANAWEALHPGAIGIGEGEAGVGGGDLSFDGAGDGEVELPRLSRCIRVFVAWNGKT